MAMASAQKPTGVSKSNGSTTTSLQSTSGTEGTEQTISPDNNDLIAMNSPSPAKSRPNRCEDSNEINGGSDMKISSRGVATEMSAQQRLDFEEQLLKKESRMAELDRLITESAERTESFRAECAKRRESEDQMKQVRGSSLNDCYYYNYNNCCFFPSQLSILM